MSAFYVLTGQVTYRMSYNQFPHIRVRSGIFNFVRRVLADLQQHYCSDKVIISLRTNSASTALNKWIKGIIGGDHVVHGLRHSRRDRLRAVECPLDIIDEIGGWRPLQESVMPVAEAIAWRCWLNGCRRLSATDWLQT